MVSRLKVRNWLIKKLGGYTRAEYASIGAFKPVKVQATHEKIETFEVRKLLRREMIPVGYPYFTEYTKREMAYDIANKLYDEDYFEFLTKEDMFDPFDSIEIICRLKAVRPKEVVVHDDNGITVNEAIRNIKEVNRNEKGL